ncbi:MAG TPA: site-2 protease family protein [Methanothrix sp.]|nr:site-2 protease family protein [Methanothrix sp.]HPJ84073.1 site-2 protease family protein [Methanothrix sp.]HPR65883.1 site-2 protease family protein [Methanothrix sp.]
MSPSSRIGRTELLDLSLSLAVLAFAFSIIIGNSDVPGAEVFFISAVGVGSGFLLHEMAHKFVAQRYGYWAEYRANRMGLVFIIAMAFMGFIFAVPGAVIIRKDPYDLSRFARPIGDDFLPDKDEMTAGREELWISLAGPMTNIVLTLLFFSIIKSGVVTGGIMMGVAYFGFFINLILAGFNMIPVGPLDGAKIFRGSRLIWAIVGIPTILAALPVFFGVRII